MQIQDSEVTEMAVTTIEERNSVRTLGEIQLSLAGIVFLFIVTIAAVLRFGYLGAIPLAAEEAPQALLAWDFWQPALHSAGAATVSPAYFTFTTVLFALLGAGDVVARLAPGIFGILTVALPWLWRSELGNAGAFAASMLLAVSPTMNMLSTTAGGEAISVFAVLSFFIAWMRFRAGGGRRWLLTSGFALGLGLATSPLFLSLMFALLVATLLDRLFSSGDKLHPSEQGAALSTSLKRLISVSIVLTFLLSATLFLIRPQGLGNAAAQLSTWLGQFQLAGGLHALALPILALARYELVIVTMGAGAILWASWRGYQRPLLLVYWFAAALFLLLLQQGTVVNIAGLVLPSYLLLGLWLHHALKQAAGNARWALIVTLLVLGGIAYFNGARYLRLMTTAPQQLGFLFLAFVAIAATFVAINFVRSWDRGAATQGAIIGFLLLFVVYNWGTARWMLAEGRADPREYWAESGGGNDLRLVAQTLEEISWQATSSPHDLQVLAAVDTHQLRWYLRDFSDTAFGETVPPDSTQHAIITRAGDDVLAPGDDYLGGDFVLMHTTATGTFETPMTLTDTLRWWIFHEHPATTAAEKIILWARNDALQE